MTTCVSVAVSPPVCFHGSPCCRWTDLVPCVWQIHAGVIVEQKKFEVLAMIEDTDEKIGGPALLDSAGKQHCKPKFSFFPDSVAEQGAWVTVQEAKASQVTDEHNIKRLVAKIDDTSCPPPDEHPAYDDLNRSVRSLFRGMAMSLHASLGELEELQKLLEYSSQGIDFVDYRDMDLVGEAAGHGYSDIVELLADHGANVNRTSDGMPPVLTATVAGHLETVAVLARYPASSVYDDRTPEVAPAAMRASGCECVGSCRCLKKFVAWPSARCRATLLRTGSGSGWTLLWSCCSVLSTALRR